MFKKLLSNLPYNPSLVGKVAFYAKRLHREASIRRMGFGFLAIAFVVQGFAALYPTKPVGASDNDMFPGGFANQADAVNACHANTYQFKTILAHFQITCNDLYFGVAKNIDYAENEGRMYSMGRTPYPITGQVEYAVPGAGTYYFRPLSNDYWGRHCNPGTDCRAIVGQRGNGTQFWLLLGCGNLAIDGPPEVTPPPTPPPPPPPPPPPTPKKVIVCSALAMNVANKSTVPVGTTISVRGQFSGRNLDEGDALKLDYEFIDASNGTVLAGQQATGVTFDGSTATDPNGHSFVVDQPGTYVFRVSGWLGNDLISGSNAGNCVKEVTVEYGKPCEEAKDKEDLEACLDYHKKVRNDTQGIEDANGTKANPSDVLTYTLSVTNRSKDRTFPGKIVKENISDILEYATVTDYHGGTKDDENFVTWPATDIPAGDTIEKELTVKVKSKLPQTPRSATNPGSFDMLMTNVYGDTVNVKLPPSPPKQVETTTTSLPNTGPGETLAIGFIITVVAGYFFARSRLMAKELDIVRDDYAAGGTA